MTSISGSLSRSSKFNVYLGKLNSSARWRQSASLRSQIFFNSHLGLLSAADIVLRPSPNPSIPRRNIFLVWLFSDSCCLFDAIGHFGAIVLPGITGPVGIAHEFFAGAPVVLYRDKRRAFVEIEIEPVVRVMGIGRVVDRVDAIIGDVCPRLCRKRIDAAHVVHMFGIVMDI